MKNYQIIKIFALFILILVTSSCSFGGEVAEDDNWENEVLLASECGMDGLQCCPEPEEACKYGQDCCVDPQNPALNFCADDCTLGIEGNYCRQEDPKCDPGTACSDGRCIPCGLEESPCCYGEAKCDDGLVCNEDTCEQCGLPGNICCENGKACANEDLFSRGRTECQRNNVCSYCGYGGAIACSKEPFCNAEHLLNGTTCFQCGALNQPCCQVDELNKTECDQEDGLKCELGFCTK